MTAPRKVGPSGRTASEQVKNKVEKRGMFLDTRKLTAKTPRQPRNPPQLHQQKTITKQPFFAKSPYFSPLHHARKKHAKH
ncbi:hypothetical protein [Granulicella sp. S190]|uniref:hypothetical protein n=1 Tax=Granulicella sp. S190 TaxID=1747226 RepID=UPI001C202525|nr:hypothetical protein [Granulicella sp. S190]